MRGICQLCLKDADLLESHIVPKFVWKWHSNPVPGGVRTNRAPDLKVQDGPKINLLCSECEQRLSAWEKLFARRIFLPLHSPVPVTKPIFYENWALKFAVSVSWRTSIFMMQRGAGTRLSPLQLQLIGQAQETWRKFLLEEVENPGVFDQHLLPVDVLESYSGPKISPFLNRYMIRDIHLDLIFTRDSIYIYTKMCRLTLFGRIQEEHPEEWQGMQLGLRGDIRPRTYRIPAGIAAYWNRKADEVKKALESMSPRQQAIAKASFYKNVDKIANSEIFRAMQHDFFHSGIEAFKKEDQGIDADGT